MPIVPTYPGVYIEELPSQNRTIVGVSTSITAFIGRAKLGPLNKATRIQSFADYDRRFGGLWASSSMSYAVQQYFLNGGSDALIIRVYNAAGAANDGKSLITLTADGGDPTVLEADNPGVWGNRLQAAVDYKVNDESNNQLFNLFVQLVAADNATIVAAETFRNVSVDPLSYRFVQTVLEEESALVKINTLSAVPPKDTGVDAQGLRKFVSATAESGSDGNAITSTHVTSGPGMESAHEGIWALDKVDLFNLLCIPPYDRETGTEPAKADYDTALKYCMDHRAMLLIDPPATWDDIDDAEAGANGTDFSKEPNAIVYFPRVRMADPLRENRLDTFVPCGVMAGVIARTDADRGVWKAPAGIEASLRGVTELAYRMTDKENGRLNPLGVNCLRTFPVIGNVAWGARSAQGADQFASQWKYIPVRRLALYIEESLYRGTQFAVFEPNDEPLWALLRLSVGSFMQDLFRKGAFQGSSPRQAYLVKCDSETTTQGDIDRGIVNIIVGFAPLKPAEFVIIKIQQLSGQDQA